MGSGGLGFSRFLFRWVCVCVCVFKVSWFVFVCVCVCLCGFLFEFVPMGFWVFKVDRKSVV